MIDEILSTVDDTTFGKCIAKLATYTLILRAENFIFVLDSYSDKESWNDIMIACSPLAANWKQLSGLLGLSFETIKEI